MQKEVLDRIANIWESNSLKDSKMKETENLLQSYIIGKLRESHKEEMLKAGPEIFIYREKYDKFVEDTKEIRKLIETVSLN